MFAQICAHIFFVPLATVPTLLHLCYRTFPVLKLNITKMLFNNQYIPIAQMNFCLLFQMYSLTCSEHVSPVKHQGKCGSCVAFATIGAVETCFHRVTKRFSDYSEQQLIDCGFGHKGANGCHDAGLDSYFDWLLEYKVDLAGEDQYPYMWAKPTLDCPADIGVDANLEARVKEYFSINRGNEKQLKELVVSHGAIISTVAAHDEFKAYNGGIFEGCKPDAKDNHAVLVVGYGTTDEGEDYWLVKNSWGVGWGEDGFMRMKRGVKMCGIGRWLAGVECALMDEDVGEDTDDSGYDDSDEGDYENNYVEEKKRPDEAFGESCSDTSSNCATYPKSYCTLPKGIGQHCQQYCGIC